MTHLVLVHVELSEANAFVLEHHRHHKPVAGHRFSLGAEEVGGQLVGVAIIGRPVARNTDHRVVVEVTRLATIGGKNVCSFLYGASARAARALGYGCIQTFILESEPGTSLRAAGWSHVGDTSGGDWNCKSRGGRRTDQPMCGKQRWERLLLG